MADTISVKVDGGVRVARALMLLFGLGAICVFRPDASHVLASLLIFGAFWGIPAWLHSQQLKQLDDQGATAGFGRRFLWSDLKHVHVVALKRGSRTVNYRFVLEFKGGKARFAYNQTPNAKEAVAFLERIAQRPLLPT
jgi:hypothetical protein